MGKGNKGGVLKRRQRQKISKRKVRIGRESPCKGREKSLTDGSEKKKK